MESKKTCLETIWDDRPKQFILGLCLLLIAGVAAVYVRVVGFGFVDYDDPFYVTRNPQVLAGLTLGGVKWAFTTMHAGNWIPLVWLSLMADRSIFGIGAGGFHLVNVVLHIANTVLLFWVLKRCSKSLWPSFFVAALFGLHPLHVESVAWVTERKDVLSMLFWMLTMLSYVRYVERRTAWRYITVCVTFALGLMAKSMLVTLPLVLLLMDYWPLKRLWPEDKKNGFAVGHLLLEKLPLAVMSVLACAVTVIAQKSGGSVAKISVVPLDQRIGNALVSYCQYLVKTFWPVDLAVYYPHPIKSLAGWEVAAAFAVLLAITIVVILLHRRYLLVGWFWYLGTLVPVIGFVQVGAQAMADRYTYIPLTGIFIMLTWFAGDIVAQRRSRQAIAGVIGAAILGVLGVMTFVQVGYWRDTMSLFTHCAAVTPDNVVVREYLGIGFAGKGNAEAALREFKEALRFEPTDIRTFYNVGNMLVLLGRTDEAIEYYNRVLEAKPGDADTCISLASARIIKGETGLALDSYREGLKYHPGNTVLRGELALALLQLNRLDEGITELEQLVKIKADSTTYCNLGIAWAQKGRFGRAIEYYEKSIQLKPDNAKAHYNLGNAYFAQNMPEKAIAEYRAAIRVMPDYVRAYDMLAIVLIQTGKIEEAIVAYKQALKIDPADKNAQVGLEKIRAARKGGSPKQ
jgi:tetratricopeptide (TPR) repeat protein